MNGYQNQRRKRKPPRNGGFSCSSNGRLMEEVAVDHVAETEIYDKYRQGVSPIYQEAAYHSISPTGCSGRNGRITLMTAEHREHSLVKISVTRVAPSISSHSRWWLRKVVPPQRWQVTEGYAEKGAPRCSRVASRTRGTSDWFAPCGALRLLRGSRRGAAG